MIDITRFDTYKELMDYKREINLKKEQLECVLSKDIGLIGNWVGNEKNKIKNNAKIVDKTLAIQYINYLKEEWEMTLPGYEEFLSLKEECKELNSLFSTNDLFGNSVLNEYHKKTNREWLDIINKLMNARGDRKYSIKFFDRNITVIGVGTHSDEAHYYNVEKRIYVAIAADDFDITEVHNYHLSWPDEHPETYSNNDFVLYDDDANEKNYLDVESSVFRLYGMPEDVYAQIKEIVFQEYKKHTSLERGKAKTL
ncbi:MAG: hypothetical protein RR189_02450 [Bacilli bacterium]